MTTLTKNFISTRRGFSTCFCLCGKKSRVPFDHRFPVTAKHVNSKRKGGSDLMSEKLAVHVVQPTGYIDRRNYLFRNKKEMIPEFIVPDLTGFKLKAYVPYNVPAIQESEVTPEGLFDSLYSEKVTTDFKHGKLTKDTDVDDMEQLDSLKTSS